MAAINKYTDTKKLIEQYCDSRLQFLKSLKTFPVFGKGWERRINEVEAESLRMLG
jgi:lysozyme family protein